MNEHTCTAPAHSHGVCANTRQDKTRQGKARQGKARQGKARQDKTRGFICPASLADETPHSLAKLRRLTKLKSLRPDK